MPRCPNWPEALANLIEERRSRPFVWGRQDCCLFACDWLLRLMAVDPATELHVRGKYDDALKGSRILKRHGGLLRMADRYCAKHDWPRQPVTYAQRGDLVFWDKDESLALGICSGARSIFVGPKGLEFRSTLDCRASWRIL